MFLARDDSNADGLTRDETLAVRRVEQRAGANGRDELEAIEGLVGSSSNVTP